MRDKLLFNGTNLLSFYLGGALVASTVIYSMGAPGLSAVMQGAMWPVDIAYYFFQLVTG